VIDLPRCDLAMKIHAIQTGAVQIKASQKVGSGIGPLRRLHLLTDSSWTDWLPIHAWAVETAEGVIVVDTGETSRTAEPGYFPRWHPYYRLAVKFNVAPDVEIGPQLLKLGIRSDDVRTVILTHLHTDHAGGLHHFPRSEILVSRKEYQIAKGFAGRLRGYLPNRWPSWFKPKFVEFEPTSFGRFDHSCRITADGRVVVVPTPGHTPGHVSVIVQADGVSYFLAGDSTYTQQLLVQQRVDGVSPSKAQSMNTLKTILGYARENRTVYLPCHDPESVERLKKVSTVEVENKR
jgi:N-acyl homoserine lactone hydrolase